MENGRQKFGEDGMAMLDTGPEESVYFLTLVRVLGRSGICSIIRIGCTEKFSAEGNSRNLYIFPNLMPKLIPYS